MTIAFESPDQPEVIALIAELDAYQDTLYPPESRHYLDLASLKQSNVFFAVVRDSAGRAIGCGAVVLFAQFGELKRMYVSPRVRGQGVARKLLAALNHAGWVWNVYFASHAIAEVMIYLWVGTIGGFVVALVTIFNKLVSPYTSPVYALLEGFAIGAISALYESKRPGIALQAVGLTMGTLACMLAAYRFRIIKVTENFKMGLLAATGGIAILYLVDLVLMFFGHPVSFIHEGGTFGILFSLFVVGIAALNLVMDFDFIAKGVAQRSPKYMEWYSAFGLIVTLVWLYLEILRLLGKRR